MFNDRQKLGSHVFPLTRSHGEADVNKMEISVVQKTCCSNVLQWEQQDVAAQVFYSAAKTWGDILSFRQQ